MSLGSCAKCWDNPCVCGHEYKTMTTSVVQAVFDATKIELANRAILRVDKPKLSDVRFNDIVKTPGWITSANGKLGTVKNVTVAPYHNRFSISLEIEWEDGGVSNAYWPDHCTKITITAIEGQT